MSQEQSEISIPLPPSLTTNSTLPPSASQALIAHLRATNSIPPLSTVLADSLARTGWTDRVRALSLELLRNGSCDTFPELMSEVMRRARIPKAADSGPDPKDGKSNGPGSTAKKTGGASSTANGASTPTGTNGVNQNAIALSKEWSGGPDGLPDVRIPEPTVEVGVDFLKERIRDAVEVGEDDDSD